MSSLRLFGPRSLPWQCQGPLRSRCWYRSSLHRPSFSFALKHSDFSLLHCGTAALVFGLFLFSSLLPLLELSALSYSVLESGLSHAAAADWRALLLLPGAPLLILGLRAVVARALGALQYKKEKKLED